MAAEPSQDQAKWDARYREGDTVPSPARVLQEFQHLLPASGTALDLACGLGGNALLLAGRGLSTHAWDISPVAIARLAKTAAEGALPVVTEVRNVLSEPPEAGRFEVIVVARFLERGLAPHLVNALTPGGLLYYQTFTRAKVGNVGPGNPQYRLAPNELLSLFDALRLRVYREEDRVGDLSLGFRNEAMLVGQKAT